MIAFFRRYLGVKLFLSYLAVILVGAVVLGLATRFTVPGAFNSHMGLALRSGQGMMGGNGNGPGAGMMSDLFSSFQATFNQALILALLAAGVIAVMVSLILSRGIVAPLRVLTAASHRIAAGHYGERVPAAGSDELGQLAHSLIKWQKNSNRWNPCDDS